MHNSYRYPEYTVYVIQHIVCIITTCDTTSCVVKLILLEEFVVKIEIHLN